MQDRKTDADVENRLVDTMGEGAAAAAAAAKSLQSCPTLCDPIDIWQPTRLPRPWEKERVEQIGRVALTYVHHHV